MRSASRTAGQTLGWNLFDSDQVYTFYQIQSTFGWSCFKGQSLPHLLTSFPRGDPEWSPCTTVLVITDPFVGLQMAYTTMCVLCYSSQMPLSPGDPREKLPLHKQCQSSLSNYLAKSESTRWELDLSLWWCFASPLPKCRTITFPYRSPAFLHFCNWPLICWPVQE